MHFAALRLIVATGFVVLSTAAVAQSAADADFSMMGSGKRHEAFIDQFARLAKSGDVDAMIKRVDPASLAAADVAQVREFFGNRIVPFFARYEKFDNQTAVSQAVVRDGRVGLWHFKFIVDAEGKRAPFQIALLDTDAGPQLIAIEVGQCVKDRHPRVAPCD